MRRFVTTAALTLLALTTILGGRPVAAVPRPERRRRSPTIRRCPTPGARPRTSSGRPTSPAWAGARRSSGTITSSSRRRSAPARSRRRCPASTTSTTTSRRRPRSAGWSTTSTSRPARSAGSASCTSGAPPLLAAHQEQLRVGDAGHRRRARLRLLRQHRPGRRARLQGQRRLDEGTSARSTRRSSSAPARRPVLYKDRLFIVNDNTTQSFLVAFDSKTGKEIWRVEPRRARELVDAGRLGERAAHRDRHHRARSRTARTTSTASCCGS